MSVDGGRLRAKTDLQITALVRMTDEEAWRFIESSPLLRLTTLNPDGTAQMTTLGFGVVDRRIAFHTPAESRKIRNLRRDARVAALFDNGLVAHDQLQGVSVNGVARLVEDPDEVYALARTIAPKYNPSLSAAQVDEHARHVSAHRLAVLITAEHVVSWDHRKIRPPSA